MTKIILTFPARRAVPLTRVWIRTGNPTLPLVSKWVSQPSSTANFTTSEVNEPEACRLCA
jgi:hypothetical protein